MPGKLHAAFSFFKFRDDLRLGNIRWELWPLLLVFPLSVITGNLRYFDLRMATAGFESLELMLFPMGLGWLILTFTPKRLVIPLMRLAAVLSAALLTLRIFMPSDPGRLLIFMAFQFSSGICAAAAFCLFCFELNNIERLAGMIIIQFCFGFFYIVWLAFPVFQAAGETWGGAVAMAACLIVVFACNGQKYKGLAENPDPKTGQWAGGAAFAIGLHVVYYIIMYTTGRVKWTENSLSSMAFGIGAFASIVLIIIIQLLNNRSALYVWLLFLALSLFAPGVLLYESPAARLSGSFAYGLGDGLGYVTIYYLCAASINKSKRLKMWRLSCFVFFIEYSCISGVFARVINHRLLVGNALPDHYLAFAVALVLCSVCFLLIPLMRKKLFEEDWTDGIQLQDIAEYAPLLEDTEAIIANHVGDDCQLVGDTVDVPKDYLSLTDREFEVFTMLFKGIPPKEIAFTLKISNSTVNFHRNNLYRKLGVQSIHELFARYSSSPNGKTVKTPQS